MNEYVLHNAEDLEQFTENQIYKAVGEMPGYLIVIDDQGLESVICKTRVLPVFQ